MSAALQTCCNAPLITLLAAGADACVQPPGHGKCALHIAAMFGHKEKCRLIISANRRTMTLRDGQGRCPIADAVVGGHVQVIELLHAECTAAVHGTDNAGNTLLHCAVDDVRGAAVLPYLLSCGLNVTLSITMASQLYC
jgi:Ankyrin repeats (3 copies)